jgi:hypothetical protein
MAPASASSSRVEEGVLGGEVVSRGSLVDTEPGTG